MPYRLATSAALAPAKYAASAKAHVSAEHFSR